MNIFVFLKAVRASIYLNNISKLNIQSIYFDMETLLTSITKGADAVQTELSTVNVNQNTFDPNSAIAMNNHKIVNSSMLTPNSRNINIDQAANNNDVGAKDSISDTPSQTCYYGWDKLSQDETDEKKCNNGSFSTNVKNDEMEADTTEIMIRGNCEVDVVDFSTSEKNHIAENDPLTGGIVRTSIDLDDMSSCGIGKCQPACARMFASTKAFMIVFLVAWVLQGMYFTYIVSVITTIEKLFQIKSKTSGMLLSATEVGQIATTLLLTYYAGQGHRPRWIACSMVVFAVSAFGCSIPHFIFGNELLAANSALYGRSVTTSEGSKMQDLNTIGFKNYSLEHNVENIEYNLCRDISKNDSIFNGYENGCGTQDLEVQKEHTQMTNTVLGMLFVCMLGVGVGQTAVATLGIPFIDDNVASRESAIYIGELAGQNIHLRIAL